MNQHVHKLARNSCVVVITRCRAHHTPTVTERYWIVCMWNPDRAWSPGLSLIRMQLAVRRNAVSTLDGCQQQHTCAALWAGQVTENPLLNRYPSLSPSRTAMAGKSLCEPKRRRAGGKWRRRRPGGEGGGAGVSVARSLGSGDVKLAWRAQLPRWPTHHHMTRRHKLANILAGVVRKARPTWVERRDWNAEFWVCVCVWLCFCFVVCASVYVRLLGNSEFQVCRSCEMKCMCVCATTEIPPPSCPWNFFKTEWLVCIHYSRTKAARIYDFLYCECNLQSLCWRPNIRRFTSFFNCVCAGGGGGGGGENHLF